MEGVIDRLMSRRAGRTGLREIVKCTRRRFPQEAAVWSVPGCICLLDSAVSAESPQRGTDGQGRTGPNKAEKRKLRHQEKGR